MTLLVPVAEILHFASPPDAEIIRTADKTLEEILPMIHLGAITNNGAEV